MTLTVAQQRSIEEAIGHALKSHGCSVCGGLRWNFNTNLVAVVASEIDHAHYDGSIPLIMAVCNGCHQTIFFDAREVLKGKEDEGADSTAG